MAFSGWEEDNGLFPKPMLIEDKVYACKDEDVTLEFEARFCFGEGEYWWLDPRTNKEVRVTHFSRG